MSAAIIDVISGLISAGSQYFKSEADQKAFAEQAATHLIDLDAQSAKQQGDIDNTEAASSSLFVAGWRPFVGWVCGIGTAFAWLIKPIIQSLLAITITFGVDTSKVNAAVAALPTLDLQSMLSLMSLLLGLGAYHVAGNFNLTKKK